MFYLDLCARFSLSLACEWQSRHPLPKWYHIVPQNEFDMLFLLIPCSCTGFSNSNFKHTYVPVLLCCSAALPPVMQGDSICIFLYLVALVFVHGGPHSTCRGASGLIVCLLIKILHWSAPFRYSGSAWMTQPLLIMTQGLSHILPKGHSSAQLSSATSNVSAPLC